MSRKIIIVEDEPMVAEDIAGHLESAGFTVASICHTAEEAIQFMSENPVDGALLDISLGGAVTGLDVAKHINETIRVPFVFLTSHSDRGTIDEVKACRAGGYIVKPFNERDLLTSLELAMSNHDMLHPSNPLLDVSTLNGYLDIPVSQREFEVLKAMRDGKTNSELADTLFLSVNTVKTHLKHIYEKLGVKNRTEALFKLDSFK